MERSPRLTSQTVSKSSTRTGSNPHALDSTPAALPKSGYRNNSVSLEVFSIRDDTRAACLLSDQKIASSARRLDIRPTLNRTSHLRSVQTRQ